MNWGRLDSNQRSPKTRDLQSLAIAAMRHPRECWRKDLNPQPSDYKSGALPIELRQQMGGLCQLFRLFTTRFYDLRLQDLKSLSLFPQTGDKMRCVAKPDRFARGKIFLNTKDPERESIGQSSNKQIVICLRLAKEGDSGYTGGGSSSGRS